MGHPHLNFLGTVPTVSSKSPPMIIRHKPQASTMEDGDAHYLFYHNVAKLDLLLLLLLLNQLLPVVCKGCIHGVTRVVLAALRYH